MADLTVLDAKIAEVLGLAQAAQGAIDRVSKLVDDDALRAQLEQVKREAVETETEATPGSASVHGQRASCLARPARG
jgi:hypothetical protein